MITMDAEVAEGRVMCPLSMNAAVGVDEPYSCLGENCMAWRTMDGNADIGFCGMVPVLPFQLRSEAQQHCGCGPVIIGQPHLNGSAS